MPYISLYFDHKLADDVSTYKKPLLYGPIVPGNYTSENVINATDMTEEYSIIPSILYENENNELLENLITKFISENTDSTEIFNKKKKNLKLKKDSTFIANFLLKKLRNNDICDVNIQNIAFQPFINMCCDNENLLNNIQDPDIINFNYILFMIPEHCLEQNQKECSVSIQLIPPEIITDKNIEITSKINSVVCPNNWYKKGELMMKCISEL